MHFFLFCFVFHFTLAFCQCTNPWTNQSSTHLKPSFIIVGAEKSGTTSLYLYLGRHPSILKLEPKKCRKDNHAYIIGDKEIRFFNKYGIDADDLESYLKLFPLVPPQLHSQYITGEASPQYMYAETSAENIAKLLPDTNILILLRNPIDRAYSHFNHAMKINIKQKPFKYYFEQEMSAIEKCNHVRKRSGWGKFNGCCGRNLEQKTKTLWAMQMLRRGMYASQIEPYLKLFPASQIMILRSEDLFSDTEQVLQKVVSFLKLKPYENDFMINKKYNFVEMNKLEVLQKNTERYRNMNKTDHELLAIFYQKHVNELYLLLQKHNIHFTEWEFDLLQ